VGGRHGTRSEGDLAGLRGRNGPRDAAIHLLNVETGEHRELGPRLGADDPAEPGFLDIAFTASGELVSLESGAVRRWSLADGSVDVIREGSWTDGSRLAVAPDGRRLAVVGLPANGESPRS